MAYVALKVNIFQFQKSVGVVVSLTSKVLAKQVYVTLMDQKWPA